MWSFVHFDICTQTLSGVLVVGMGGWTALVGYGLYNIKKRKTTLPLYLIHLRVSAQVFAIGCMVSVVGYRIFLHEKKKFSKEE